jgi:NAD(P)-dependent dehydrogenase (short-subunit alcohol dehydrogenase family)
MQRTALVTGGNRGIGHEVCRQLSLRGLRVILAARDADMGTAAARDLSAAGLDVRFAELDVASGDSVSKCAGGLISDGVDVDVLVNNAGVYRPGSALAASPGAFEESWEVHVRGILRTTRTFVPAMIDRGYGRVVNVSSGYGSFGEGLEGPAAYSVTKAALNALTLKLAQEVDGRRVKVNSVCPGWVRTRMGGDEADLGVEEGADSVVWLATLPSNGPHGGFFRKRKRIPW